MFVVLKKDKVLMKAKTLQGALDGLAKGTYKVGEYSISCPDGKVIPYCKYLCVRKAKW